MITHIHHVELSHMSPNLSGGEKALIETLRYLAIHTDYKQTVYTSISGEKLYRKLLGDTADQIGFVTIGSPSLELKSEIVAYYTRIIQLLRIVKKLPKDETNVIFSHEEFLPTALYSYIEKKLNPKAKWIIFFHMKSPRITRGFEGEYTNKRQLPNLRIIRYKFEQWLYFKLTKNKIDKVITVNPIYTSYLAKKYKKPYTIEKFGGEPLKVIHSYSGVGKMPRSKDKIYDLCFMGRFHAQKGIFELVDIIDRLRQVKPDVSLVLIGGGSAPISKKFFELVREKGIEKNIDYKGYISSDEKFKIVSQAKIFLFPSYYESFGQVALEAMMCGLPVIAYDLPPYIVFKKGMVKVPILNNQEFADAVIALLHDKKKYNSLSKEAMLYAKTFSWDKTAQEIDNTIKSVLK